VMVYLGGETMTSHDVVPTPASLESLIERRSRATGREEAKLTIAVAHEAIALFEAGALGPERIEHLLPILQEAIALRGFPEEIVRAQAKMRGALLRAKGLIDVSVLAELKAKVSVEGGVVSIGDASLLDGLRGVDVEEVNAGRAFAFATGGDGAFSVAIRVIGAPEPVLEERESTGRSMAARRPLSSRSRAASSGASRRPSSPSTFPPAATRSARSERNVGGISSSSVEPRRRSVRSCEPSIRSKPEVGA